MAKIVLNNFLFQKSIQKINVHILLGPAALYLTAKQNALVEAYLLPCNQRGKNFFGKKSEKAAVHTHKMASSSKSCPIKLSVA